MRRWCVVQSDDRTLRRPHNVSRSHHYWSMVAQLNYAYAQRHGYGYLFVEIGGDGTCPQLAQKSIRHAAWCKILVVAHALLRGIDGQACDSGVLYLDSDAHLANESLSIDQYLNRAKARGDEALQDENDSDAWRLLFASNYWFESDRLNSGVFFVRGGSAYAASSCGLLRRWWGARWPSNDDARPWEQAPLNTMYERITWVGKDRKRPNASGSEWRAGFGSRIRLLPTARFFRRKDSHWWQTGRWSKLEAPEAEYSHSDFIHHGVRQCDDFGPQFCGKEYRDHAYATPKAVRIDGNKLARVFDEADNEYGPSACPPAQAEPNTPRDFDAARWWLSKGQGISKAGKLWMALFVRTRNHTTTNLDGSPSDGPRPCWRDSQSRAEERRREVWMC